MFLYWLVAVIIIVKISTFFEENKIKIVKRKPKKLYVK